MARELYEFGRFQLDPEGRRLLRDGKPVSITPKAFDTLRVLVLRRDESLSRQDLIAQIWPDTTVGEYSLNQCIAVLRRVLEDNPRQPVYIATLPGRGYAFICEVRKLSVANGEARTPLPVSIHADANCQPVREDRRRFVPAAAAVLAIAALGYWYFTGHLHLASAMRRVKPRPSVAVLPLKNLTHRSDQTWLSTALPE